jgi:hypothetical protein
MKSKLLASPRECRRSFIGGSDARVIMGQDGNASIHVHRRLKNPHKS